MKIHVFGTCSGTEPYPNRHHCGFAMEAGDKLYWFDAGECCSYTAHLMGVDLLKLRHIFISHPHMDHVGGLGDLLWTVRKLDRLSRYPDFKQEALSIHVPDIRSWNGIWQMLQYTEEGFQTRFPVEAEEYGDGVLVDDGTLRITALHNHHLKHEEGTPWHSFGFRVEGEGKSFVYSGDTGGIEDYAPLMENCDLLFMETGHHHPPLVAAELLEKGIFPAHLCFIHHGRDILDRYEEQVEQLDQICPGKYTILSDAMTLEL